MEFWVDGAAGNDGNTGTSFAQAWATMDKAATEMAAAVDGSAITLYVVNSTTYTMDLVSTMTPLDGKPTSTALVLGVSDAAKTPALVTVQSTASTACAFMYVRDWGSATFRGFTVDFSPSIASATTQQFIAYRDLTHGPVFVEDCVIKGSPLGGAMPAGARRIINDQGLPPSSGELGEVRYCVLENLNTPLTPVGSSTLKFDLHNCVCITDTTSAALSTVIFPNLASASNDMRVYNNTFYLFSNTSLIVPAVDHNASSGDQGRMDLYNNVFWYNNTNAIPMPSGFIGGGTGGSFSAGTRGNNIFYTGPDITSVEAGSTYQGAPWSPPYSGDVEQYEKAATVLFIAPSSSLLWTASGNGYTLTVAKDLRLILHTSAGVGGSLPGALPSVDVDISIEVSTSNVGPLEGETAVLTVEAANAGPGTEPGLVVSAPVPSGLTYVSDVPSTGSYDSGTGLWSLSLADSGLATLQITVTVDAGTRGNTINFVGSVDSTLGTDTDATNDEDTVILTIGQPSGQPTLPEYIDVLPFFKPVYEVDFDPTFIITIAGEEVDLLAFFQGRPEKQLYNENTVRRIIIPADTTIDVNMGGVEYGQFLMIESSGTINVGIDAEITSVSWPVTSIALETTFSELHIQNPSLTDSITVQLAIVD